MSEKLQNSYGMLRYANSNEFADSAGENHSAKHFEHSHFTEEQREKQEKVRFLEIQKAEKELEDKLSFFEELAGAPTENEITNDYSTSKERINEDVSIAEKIRIYKENLSEKNLPPKQIIQNLINRFEDEKAVSTWVENWKNYLELHDFAETKPEKEKKAIQLILTTADYDNENSFGNTLTAIYESEDVSDQTKFEIHTKFRSYSKYEFDKKLFSASIDSGEIKSTSDIDRTFDSIRKEKDEAKINLKKLVKLEKELQNEITALEEKLKTSKGKEKEKLEAVLASKIKEVEEQEQIKAKLEFQSTQPESFEIRKGFVIMREKDGGRIIRHENSKTEIKLIDSVLPFAGDKNLDSLNFAFPFSILKEYRIEDFFFPLVENGESPDRRERKLATSMLKQLGINTQEVLSERDLEFLKKAFGIILNARENLSPKENLEAIKIVDSKDSELNESQFAKVLRVIRENRNLSVDRVKEKITK